MTSRFRRFSMFECRWRVHSLKETGRGAGADSEQSFEANHIDMDNAWGRNCVRDLISEAYRAKLLRAVCNLNASHTPIQHHDDHGRGGEDLEQTDQRGIWEGAASTVMHRFICLCCSWRVFLCLNRCEIVRHEVSTLLQPLFERFLVPTLVTMVSWAG